MTTRVVAWGSVSVVELLLLVFMLAGNEPRVVPVEVPGVTRVLRVDDHLLVGSKPSPESYAALKSLGVRVVLSVDGMSPDLELITAAGLRSVHLPLSYGGVPEARLRSLKRLAREEPGAIFVHCHLGRHRGPTAAAALWMLRSGGTPGAARRILEHAGTSHAYAGLWATVADFSVPEGDCSEAPLPARLQVEGVVASMVRLQGDRDAVDLIGPKHPDLTAAHQALLIEEGLRELHRLDPGGNAVGSKGWTTDLTAALEAAGLLRAADPDDLAAWSTALDRLDATCAACHVRHRN
jgi:protein tyrosine phosphatase (PTP) superfamily phosphohydrolase (DUF442 family)